MDIKKNIDRLFQEKLEGLEVTPQPEVWDAIEARLQKKKRRVLPLWWMLGGIASMVIIGGILYPFVTSNPSDIEEVIITESKDNPIDHNLEENTEPQVLPQEKTSETVVANKSEITREPINQIEKINKNTHHKKTLIAYENSVSGKEVEGSLPEHKKSVPQSVQEENKVANNQSFLQKEDSIVQKTFVKKNLMAEVAKQDSVSTTTPERNRWSISPVVAVTHNNSFSNTSSIDKSLNTANTQGGNTFSYGVKLAYQLDKKWAIQSGLFVQKIGFSNSHLSVLNNVRTNAFENIDYSSEPVFLVSSENSSLDVNKISAANIETTDASLQQNYSYYEVPVEIKYTVLEGEKFSSKLVTGFSSLFLNQNDISITSKKLTKSLGKANNLNTVNFSGNFGLDFEYSISKKIRFAVNPMLKIQLHTFSKNSNDFKPYTLGVYSGIIYQF